LFREVDVLHRVHVLRRGLADTRCDDNGVGFENDAVVYELVDREGLCMLVWRLRTGYGADAYHEVVVLDYGALVDRVPVMC
jgi:hypothetical protein